LIEIITIVGMGVSGIHVAEALPTPRSRRHDHSREEATEKEMLAEKPNLEGEAAEADGR